MRNRLDDLLAGAAVAAILVFSSPFDRAWAQSAPAESGLPAAATVDFPPPTAAEIGAPAKPEAAKVANLATPETTGTVNPAAPASAADLALADKLRAMSDGKFDRLLGGRKERTAVEAFYGARNFSPVWIANGVFNERARAVAVYLAGVDAHGLEPDDYQLPQMREGLDADALAELELKFTDTVLTYARHAETGRVHFSRVAADIDYDRDRTEANDVLARVANAADPGMALDSFQPPHAGYKALKAKLAESRRGAAAPEKPRLPGGLTLRYVKAAKGKPEVVMNDPRVPQLRERFEIEGDRSDTRYDAKVAAAVAGFQKSNKLRATGQLDAATVQAINGPSRDREAEIIAINMERWRWMPRDLGAKHVMVNIPDYSLRVFRDGKLYWNTRIVVGKPSQATPIMTAEMKFITVNPTWNVPPSIIKNEYLPALAQDPTALERMGLKIAQTADGTVRIWQPPGDKNALGRIRFNFPNKFLVYQHDTPDKQLFAHEKRAYSHGCMRVQDPLKYGEVLLSLVLPQENYTAERLRKMFGGSEVNINFPATLPVHLTYQTAFVDDQGKLVIREDIYGRDARMMALLKGSERKMADVVMARPANTSAVPVRATPGTYGGGGGGWNGPSFFDALFGGFQQQQPPRPPARTRSAGNRGQ